MLLPYAALQVKHLQGPRSPSNCPESVQRCWTPPAPWDGEYLQLRLHGLTLLAGSKKLLDVLHVDQQLLRQLGLGVGGRGVGRR